MTDKEFPVHLFVKYCPESGVMNVDPGAPIAVRKALRIGYARGKNGNEYGAVWFTRKVSGYKEGQRQMTHLAWKIQTGEWPKGNIRFVDGDYKNLKWGNLRQECSDKATEGEG